MKNSIVKLEDFELDEISGGININKEKAKQVAKKTAGYAIKGLCTAILGSSAFVLSYLEACELGYGDCLYDFLKQKLENRTAAQSITMGVCCGIPIALAGAAGWNFGSLLCKKLGLED